MATLAQFFLKKYIYKFSILTEEDWSVFLFYGSTSNSLSLESSFKNNNFYESYEFVWSCLPMDERCPYCPSESRFFFFSLIFSFFLTQFYFSDNIQGIVFYSTESTPSKEIIFDQEFETGHQTFFILLYLFSHNYFG